MSKAKIFPAWAAAVALFFAACATGPTPRWRYDETGQPHEYKRYARNMATNGWPRFLRKAYNKVEPDRPLDRWLSDDQRDFVAEHGQPEYVRRPFMSRTGEQVDEWLYLAQNRLVQWVKGHTVFEGEITDVERVMVRYGYPSGVLVSQAEPDLERFTFVYDRPLDLEHEVFSFSGGKIVLSQTQR